MCNKGCFNYRRFCLAVASFSLNKKNTQSHSTACTAMPFLHYN
uniref:Uncharacterized protein n=1 Tax=Anguilla anguilla TaxID=7936 RepID=A0A0E9XMZ3_ANGAN